MEETVPVPLHGQTGTRRGKLPLDPWSIPLERVPALRVLLLGCLLDLRTVLQADNIGWHENGCEDDLYRGFYMPQQ